MPTQNTYIFNPTSNGLNFTASSQTWTIANAIFVGSGTSTGVFSNYSYSKLVNKGYIHSDEYYGAIFYGDNNTIVNKSGADISGHYGVYVDGLNDAITNHGTIVGSTAYGIWDFNGPHASITNDGDIYGHAAGVYVESGVVGAHGSMIDNAGTIHSDEYGVYVATDAGETTNIVNEHDGTIKGLFESIYAASGKLHLENHGTIKGTIYSGAAGARDKVFNYGNIKGSVYLGDGNDVYKNKGGHAQKVDGGYGNDKLVGGPTTDKFVFSTGLNALNNVDTVKHFTPGADKFFLDAHIFTSLTGTGTLKGSEFHVGKHAHDSNDYIIYNKNNGHLYYDPDGSGTTLHQVQFAQLDKGLNLTHHDFTVFA